MKITQFCKVRERIEGVYSVYNLNLGNKEYGLGADNLFGFLGVG